MTDKTDAQRCTCPSGDGSLRWPCPKHPPAPLDVAALRGLVTKWRAPESPPLQVDQLRQAVRNGGRADCADELESILASDD